MKLKCNFLRKIHKFTLEDQVAKIKKEVGSWPPCLDLGDLCPDLGLETRLCAAALAHHLGGHRDSHDPRCGWRTGTIEGEAVDAPEEAF